MQAATKLKIIHNTDYPDPMRFFDDRPSFIPQYLGRYILDNFYKVFTLNNHFYIYQDGKYMPNGKIYIKKIAQKLLDYKAKKNLINLTLDWIANETALLDADDVNPNDGLINCKNGLLDWRNGQLKPHTPHRLSTIQLPVTYDPTANDEVVINFIKSIVPADSMDTLIEFLGYCLIPTNKFQKALLCIGSGANGESTLFNMFTAMIGKENISNVSLQDLDNNRFKPAQLYGKLINIFADIPKEPLRQTSIFKSVTGGDRISAEFKNENAFDFTPFAKLIFSANELPRTNDQSIGFYRRLLIMPFPCQFTGDNCDPDLINKLITDYALSTLFNLSLEGLKRLEKNNNFTKSDSVDEALATYRGKVNSIDKFVESDCAIKKSYYCTVSDLKNEYIKFCEDHQIKPEGIKVFNRHLIHKYNLKQIRKHNQPHMWQGIKIL
jgi:putative DNA primase/helicase